MTGSVLILLAISPPSSAGSTGLPDVAILAIAEQSFTEGTALRHDSAKARPAFARSAIAYDELWQRGFHGPELALNRAHAHQLAGDLPGAIAALHEGMAVSRWNRPLQVALEDARSAVGYPLIGDLASQCRPTSSPTIGNRMSPAEAWSIAALLWLLACGGMARFVMTRAMWWLFFAGLAVAVHWHSWAVPGSRIAVNNNGKTPIRLLIVTDDVLLRTGTRMGMETPGSLPGADWSPSSLAALKFGNCGAGEAGSRFDWRAGLLGGSPKQRWESAHGEPAEGEGRPFAITVAAFGLEERVVSALRVSHGDEYSTAINHARCQFFLQRSPGLSVVAVLGRSPRSHGRCIFAHCLHHLDI